MNIHFNIWRTRESSTTCKLTCVDRRTLTVTGNVDVNEESCLACRLLRIFAQHFLFARVWKMFLPVFFVWGFFLWHHVTCARARSEWLAKGNRVMPCCHPSLSVTSQQVRAHSAVSAPYMVSISGNRWQSHLVPELLVEIRLVTLCCCGLTLYFERCWQMSHHIFI